MVRNPLVAGQFYPADAGQLKALLDELLGAHIKEKDERKPALLAIVPHAGYIYSGALAGRVFAELLIPEHVLLIGPNHSGRGANAALAGYDAWKTPLGLVPRNEELDSLLLKNCRSLKTDNQAHDYEHSLEVELPFLQKLQPLLKISALSLGRLSWPQMEELATGVADSIKELGRPVLTVASTDMSHYLPAQTTMAQDELALEKIMALDARGLYEVVRGRNISMCGVLAVALGLLAALKLGAVEARMIGYSHSGQANGDNQRVVGYAGALVD